jgi:hypothetical protein
MTMFSTSRTTVLVIAVGVALLALPRAAQGQTIVDPMHGFCWGPSVCTGFSNAGSNTIDITGTNPPDFGFDVSPGPLAGDYRIIILVPADQDATPTALDYTLHATGAGPVNTATFDAGNPLELVDLLPWQSGTLENYLGITTATPTNPIGNYLGTALGGGQQRRSERERVFRL